MVGRFDVQSFDSAVGKEPGYDEYARQPEHDAKNSQGTGVHLLSGCNLYDRPNGRNRSRDQREGITWNREISRAHLPLKSGSHLIQYSAVLRLGRIRQFPNSEEL